MKYGNFINGEWKLSPNDSTFKSINPADPEEIIGEFALGNKQDVIEAYEAAEKAFEIWSKTPAPKRGEILLKAAQLMKEKKEELSLLESREMGKVLVEARGDVQEAIDITEYMAGEGRRLFGFTTPSELKNKFAMTIRKPVGVVGLITPWNFPIAIPAWKIMAALICGNTIVFKPSSDTPLCAIELVKILSEAGIPPGVVNLVTGSGKDVGETITTHPGIRAISFTGSRNTGEHILKIGGIKKIGLELGGKNVIIVMEDADIKLAVDGIIWGAFGTTGQRCTACSRLLVQDTIQKKLESKLIEKARSLIIGPGYEIGTEMGPLINNNALEKSIRYTSIGQDEGAKIIYGGTKLESKGFFFQPTIFNEVSIDMRIAQEEIFGPILSVISFEKLNQAIDYANSVDYGLSSSIYTNDINIAFKAIEEIEAGITYVNSSTIGSEVHLPFGGVKKTGNGTREGGIEGINEFSETKTVYIDYSGKLQKAQIDLDNQ
ncbi:MAG: aldehyde dehydrogenase family protein [Candidatus Methanofastidiosum sp.]|nr:aldehyde dehydrogenase family protein [Methanofastidiosum sp.]